MTQESLVEVGRVSETYLLLAMLVGAQACSGHSDTVTIFRIGSSWLEVVGVRAPASNPTGPWTYLYKARFGYPIAP